MKTLNSIKFIVLLIGSMTPPAVAHRLSAQTVSWTSSNPEILSVDATGTAKVESIPNNKMDVTVTAAISQNGRTFTSAKIIQVGGGACSANTQNGECCTFNGLTYCVVTKSGIMILDRNLGAASISDSGTLFPMAAARPACPDGFRLPNTAAEARAIGVVETRNSIFNLSASHCWGVLSQQNCGLWHFNTGNTNINMYINAIYISCSNSALSPARCIKS